MPEAINRNEKIRIEGVFGAEFVHRVVIGRHEDVRIGDARARRLISEFSAVGPGEIGRQRGDRIIDQADGRAESWR